MKRNMFGNPRPKNHAEIEEAIGETDLQVSTAGAQISKNDEDEGDEAGWSAEITGEDSDGESIDPISTLGYPTKDALIADLTAAGIDRSYITVV